MLIGYKQSSSRKDQYSNAVCIFCVLLFFFGGGGEEGVTILYINELGGPGSAPFNMSPLKYIICLGFSEYCHLIIMAISLFSDKKANPGSLVSLTEYCFFRSA